MASASGIIVNGFTYTTGITRLRHPMISNGTLALLEAGDPLAGTSAVPASLPNIARSSAEARRAGAGEPWAWTEQFASGVWKRERTTKGGIHAASAETLSGKAYGTYRAPTAFNDHLKANRGRDICAFVVGRLTAKYPGAYAGGNALLGDYNQVAFAGSYQAYLRTFSEADTALSGTFYTQSAASSETVGYADGASWASGSVKIAPGSSFALVIKTRDLTTADLITFLGWGAQGTKGFGLIHYMAGIEDLTTSGRTFAQVRDLAEAWRQSEVVASTGRYFGDTWTDPATLAAA